LFDTAFAARFERLPGRFLDGFYLAPLGSPNIDLGVAEENVMGKVEGNPGVLVLKRSVLSSRRPGQDKNPSE